MQTSFEIQLVWNQVRLLVLLELVDQGGLGLWGDWGPLKFAPQHVRMNPEVDKNKKRRELEEEKT